MTDESILPAAAKSPKPKLPLKVRLAVSYLGAVTDASRRADGTINRRRLYFLIPRAAPNPTPVHGVRTSDLTIDASRNLWIRLYLPDGGGRRPRRFPLVIFFHGGGFIYCSADTRIYDRACRRIAGKIAVAVASVNYRLAPEHPFPAPYEDAVDVLRFVDLGGLDAVAGDLVDPSSCFLAGDSAGGNIAHHAARRWAAVGGWNKVNLLGIVLIQPFFGGEERTESEIRLSRSPVISTERTDWAWRAFLPSGADRDHEAANVFGPRAATGELEERFPPAMVVVGGHDPLQDRQRRYCEALRARGREVRLVEFPEAIHCFYLFPEIADGDRMIEEMGSFIRSHG